MREFTDEQGLVWAAEVASHGRTSAYLNPRVHRPIVQFSCKSGNLPRRYASLPGGRDALADLNDAELSELLKKAESH